MRDEFGVTFDVDAVRLCRASHAESTFCHDDE
jgi:hypothetical protein